MLVLCHRGYHVHLPENTLEAFQAAADMGVDGIETDLRLTADGQLILFHDRLAPDGRPVIALTRDELQRLVGHAVPLAEEALSCWSALLWNLEIKTPTALDAALELIARFQHTHRLLISSFWHNVVQQVAQRYDVECGLLVAHHLGSMDGARSSPPPFGLAPAVADMPQWQRRIRTIVWCYEFLDAAMVRAAAEAGYQSYCYAIGTPEEHAAARSWGLQGIITDRPEFAA